MLLDDAKFGLLSSIMINVLLVSRKLMILVSTVFVSVLNTRKLHCCQNIFWFLVAMMVLLLCGRFWQELCWNIYYLNVFFFCQSDHPEHWSNTRACKLEMFFSTKAVTKSEKIVFHLFQHQSGQENKMLLTCKSYGHDGSAMAITVSPDGRHVASAGGDKLIRVWSTSLEMLYVISGHSRFLLDI